MLRVLGSPKRMCDGMTRRDAIIAGGLGGLGIGLEGFLRQQAAQAASPRESVANSLPGFGRAKSVILLFLYGSPSQLETFDMKPDAPAEIRGEMKPIRSSLPGLDVCELLPSTAKVMDKVSVIRSVTHKHPIHGVAFATTGVPDIDVPMELNPHDQRHWPFIGSVVTYLEQQRNPRSAQKPVPDNIALPWAFSSRRVGEVQRAGPYAAFLGSAYNPHYAEFEGKANAKITKMLRNEYVEFDEPYVGISRDCKFNLGDATKMTSEMTIDRLNHRKSLLDQLDTARRQFDTSAATKSMDKHRAMAYSLIGSDAVRTALDVQRESMSVRDQYGHTVFGQGCLAARRLVEAGSKFVTVFWDEFGLAGSGWDTHWEHYPRMRNELMPGFDKGFYGLINDLQQRGTLDDTLVVCLSEHGRTPKIQNVKGGGRDHWSRAYSVVMAGAGLKRGFVLGKTDSIGGDVVDRPISPKDILATIYHLLGIDLETHLFDRTNRPQILVPGGQVIPEIIA
ncbi:DUF1501 domain-containing protein [Tuwongella immobilis]|uniref:DUF1501 domain-containing protein n=1 Tax=Tuwongella immobilis TaxID=692036 RepID=A0A6C2YNZ9_9BACT|nr:DUF1501 domain-containing protein [Tuwongella immobilis]VIP02612.1 arylsulfatase a family protein : Arylsulfatase A family protein OS=Singulisphaera acidiphila (strain ATCC BAA-1392 / DSM 18658 / VKM B-2454 / MOB10) GN=Sinac_4861 PE=4 SV=1: DUF1501 [Tuwongella immobilis]VTS01924.1 arylsulfatase a family protein : Arylsulfatase A family protein OS=Singulisphaera acidiphila (strain ATCC BAA-1392 / DSM 18658 / VKM B-2454 / MOB10) GN=Sinac_4861 PE=4 SV=1: DUF1501 [Tuwongella immobilis]